MEDGEIQQLRKNYVEFLVERGHTEEVALERFEVLLHEGPREGSPLHKFFNDFMNIGRSEKE